MRFAYRLFLWVGFVTLVYAGGTVASAGIYQRYQSWKFEGARVSAAARNLEEDVAAPAVIKAVRVPDPELSEGDLIGKLEIPRIRISVMVLQGMEPNTLTLGAGHVPGTPLPGVEGNVVIAAHRDTFFRKVEGIRPGDRIRFVTLRRTFQYVVDSTEIADPQDTRSMESRARPELTLITYFPFYFVGSAPNRFIVHATPVE